MMIRLNLLEEERAIRQAREHDPVRVAILLCVLVLILGGLAGMVISSLSVFANRQARAKKTQWEQEEQKQQAAQRDLDELTMVGKRQETIEKIRRKRFLYAPQLQAIKDSIPDNVQLLKLSFGQETVKVRNPKLDDLKYVALMKEKGSPIPPETEKKVLKLTLEGFVTGHNPQQAIDAFVALLNSASAVGGGEGAAYTPLALSLEQASLKSYKIQANAEKSSGVAAATSEIGRFEIICRYRS